MEPLSRPELYKWQRITSKSRKAPVTKTEAVTDDIEQWIKKVEQASDFAAAQAFGNARSGKSTKGSILQTVDQLHDHDAAYDEAQELLNEWVQGQLHSLDDQTTEAEIWSDEENVINSSFGPSIQSIVQQVDAGALSMEEYDRLMNLDNYNEDLAMENVLEQLRKTDVVGADFMHDLGDIGGKPTQIKPKKDPSVKMQIRQTQVKEKREQRRIELLKKQEQEAVRRHVLNATKHKAAEERRNAALKAKQEEVEIQKEMTRIKKELQEDRKEQLRKQEEERELERRIAHVAKEQASAKKESMPSSRHTNPPSTQDIERKRKVSKAFELAEIRHVSHNLKLLRKCFNAWFDIVLERRVHLGKARAVSDWKCLFRSWNAWRHFTRERTLERLKLEHENSMIDSHRKLNRSSVHYERSLLKKYFQQWQIWVTQERQARELEHDQNSVREKMSAFLAAGRRLAQEQKNTENKGMVEEHLAQSRVNEMFVEPSPHTKHSHKPQSARNRKFPTESWQVTRKHVKLSGQQIRDLSDTRLDDDSKIDAFHEAVSVETSVRATDSSVPKGFHNRFQAQQKIVQEQQKALREQQKMIEDLKFKQDRSLLEQQIQQQQVIQQQLEKLTKLTLEERKLNTVVPHPLIRRKSTDGADPENINGDQEPPQTSRSALSSASKITSTSSAFSKRMEERALERVKAKQEREERKRKQEEQRVAEMIAKEEELRQQEAEERKRRVEAFKEKRQLEKQRELELQQLKEITVANQRKAEEHSRLRILKFYGFRCLRRHSVQMKQFTQAAQQKYALSLQSQTFNLWKLRYDTNKAIRNEAANELYHRHLVKRCFRNWTQWRLQSQILATKADRHYQSKLVYKTFRAWLDITTREKIEMWEKERHARQHDILRLKIWVLSTWKRLPEEKRREIEREKRRDEMRKKVANLLPDYKKP